MQNINVAECVGCFTGKSSKDGKVFHISHFIYDTDDKQRAVFTTYDNCTPGQLYNFIFSNYKAVLINLDEQKF